jgi:hypothetical protein
MGLNGEDVILARAGTALDAHEAAIARLACRIVVDGVFRNRVKPHAAHNLGNAAVAAVVMEVAFAIVNCYVLQSIAPAACDTVGTRRAD